MGFAPPPRGGFAFVAAPGRAHTGTVLSRGERPHPPNELSLHRMVNFLENAVWAKLTAEAIDDLRLLEDAL